MDSKCLRAVYLRRVRADFPPAERKPLYIIERLVRSGAYDTLGYYEGERMLAYAFLWRDPEGGCVLLDYLAVCRERRGRGVGSAFLEALKKHYAAFRGIMVEAEEPGEAGTEGERGVRRRRVAFYRRAGFRQLDYRVRLFGVSYVVLAWGVLDDTEALDTHRRHYRCDRAGGIAARMVQIPVTGAVKSKKEVEP